MSSLGFGAQILQWADQLAVHSDQADGLTVAYLTRAHQTAAAEIAGWMIEAGMQVEIDAVGNVVGRYAADDPHAKTLLTGSHFDTVRNAGKYDGRLGILLPIAVVRRLHAHRIRLPFHVEVIAFADEQGCGFAPASSLRARSPAALTSVCSMSPTTMASRCAPHCALPGCRPPRRRFAPWRAIRAIWRGSSKCTSNRARCCSNAVCRWAW